jgi:glycosyltransferase involved in cell wall biosynthesis
MVGFGIATRRHYLPFDLVTIGVGDAQVPPSLEDRVVDLGYLAPAEVPDAFAAADAFLQPSTNESFSRTIMEAWLAETVVIANRQSDVVTWHCERSGGGLLYGDELELGQCLRFVAEAPDQAGQLARKGRDYVLANYRWPTVLDAMERSLEAFV